MEELSIGKSALLTDVAMCINHYRLSTPGLYVCTNIAIQIDKMNRITPGLIAMVNAGKFKQCEPNFEDHAFHGPPNFVLDVSDSQDEVDYAQRKLLFEHNKVLEYVILYDDDPLKFSWNRLVDRKYVEIQEDQEGLIKSDALPGLWILTKALKTRDWWSVLGGIDQGITRKEHHDFMRAIWNEKKKWFWK